MYHSLREIWDGFSKNVYFEARRQPLAAFAGPLLLWTLPTVPAILLFKQLSRRAKGHCLKWWNWTIIAQSVAQICVLMAYSIQVIRLLRLPLHWARQFLVGYFS